MLIFVINQQKLQIPTPYTENFSSSNTELKWIELKNRDVHAAGRQFNLKDIGTLQPCFIK